MDLLKAIGSTLIECIKISHMVWCLWAKLCEFGENILNQSIWFELFAETQWTKLPIPLFCHILLDVVSLFSSNSFSSPEDSAKPSSYFFFLNTCLGHLLYMPYEIKSGTPRWPKFFGSSLSLLNYYLIRMPSLYHQWWKW